MSSAGVAVIALLCSALPLLLLALRDPKRLRSQRRRVRATAVERRGLTGLAVLPSFFILGDAAALLLWLAGILVMGWLMALWLARR